MDCFDHFYDADDNKVKWMAQLIFSRFISMFWIKLKSHIMLLLEPTETLAFKNNAALAMGL